MHGGVGYGERNAEGERILEFCQTFGMIVANTWFTRKESRLITYKSGEGQSMIDFIIVKGGNRKQIKNVKTIAGEEIARQHKIVVCDMEMKPVKKQKAQWESRIKVWRLKEDEVKEKYENASMYAEGDANEQWEN